MARPIKKLFIGNRNVGGIGGEGLLSVTLGGTNDSDTYTVADVMTIGAPELPGGVQAEAEVGTLFADGALIEGITDEDTIVGTGIDGVGGAADVLTGVTGTTNLVGTGAVWTITKDNTNAVTDYTDISNIEITSIGSGYVLGEVVTILGTVFAGGTTPANDMVFDIASGSFVTAGTILTISVTEAGTGYTAIPTVAADTDNQNNLTLTGVLTSVNSLPTINCTGFRLAGSNLTGDIEAQKGNNTYIITTADGTFEATLTDGAGVVHGTPGAAGEMQIIATDSGSVTYSVSKLYNNTVILFTFGGGSPEFTDGTRVKWAQDGVAVLNESVSISN